MCWVQSMGERAEAAQGAHVCRTHVKVLTLPVYVSRLQGDATVVKRGMTADTTQSIRSARPLAPHHCSRREARPCWRKPHASWQLQPYAVRLARPQCRSLDSLHARFACALQRYVVRSLPLLAQQRHTSELSMLLAMLLRAALSMLLAMLLAMLLRAAH